MVNVSIYTIHGSYGSSTDWQFTSWKNMPKAWCLANDEKKGSSPSDSKISSFIFHPHCIDLHCIYCIIIISGKVFQINSYGPVFKPFKASHWFPGWSRLNLEPVINHIKQNLKMVIVSQPESTSYTICMYTITYTISSLCPTRVAMAFAFEKDVMADKVVTGCWACGKHGFPGTLGGP